MSDAEVLAVADRADTIARDPHQLRALVEAEQAQQAHAKQQAAGQRPAAETGAAPAQGARRRAGNGAGQATAGKPAPRTDAVPQGPASHRKAAPKSSSAQDGAGATAARASEQPRRPPEARSAVSGSGGGGDDLTPPSSVVGPARAEAMAWGQAALEREARGHRAFTGQGYQEQHRRAAEILHEAAVREAPAIGGGGYAARKASTIQRPKRAGRGDPSSQPGAGLGLGQWADVFWKAVYGPEL